MLEYGNEISTCDNEVVKFVMMYVDLYIFFEFFINIVRNGDVLTMERLLFQCMTVCNLRNNDK